MKATETKPRNLTEKARLLTKIAARKFLPAQLNKYYRIRNFCRTAKQIHKQVTSSMR